MVWACATCTFINERDAFVACQVCGTQRGPVSKKARVAIDLCADPDDDSDGEVVFVGARGGDGTGGDRALAERLQAAEAAPPPPPASSEYEYAWRPTFCDALGPNSPGNAGAASLGDLVAGDPRWVVASNFMIEASWLGRAWPALASCPRVVVFHGCARTARGLGAAFPGAEIHDMTPKGLKFTHPVTGNVFNNEYGCHHAKFFIIGFEDSARVVVHTANLIERDWANKSQGCFSQDFPIKAAPGSCDFEESLVRYADSLLAHAGGAARNWRGLGRAFDDDAAAALTLSAALRRFDFSRARGRLVPSAPGYHRDATLDAFGLNRVAACLRRDAPPGQAGDEVYCQFSSFSTAKDKFRGALADAFAADRAPSAPLRFVWPTAAEVRESLEGYAGGGCMPSNGKTVDLVPRQALRKWAARRTGEDAYLRARRDVVPHIKSWSRVAADGAGVRWSLLTSANLSTAAWGERQKKDTQLFVKSWELGILVTPASLGVPALATTKGAASGAALVPLPFACPPLPYGPDDEPFKWDARYAAADRFGRNGLH